MDKITLDELKNYPVWLVWGMDQSSEKNKKRPFSPINRSFSGWDKKENQSTHKYAQSFIDKQSNAPLLGVGLVSGMLPKNKSTVLCCVDIDAHNSTGKMTDTALEVLAMFDGQTYIEKSYSTKGRHIYFLMDADKLPANQKDKYLLKNADADMEFFATTEKFLVITGLEAENSCKDKTIYNLTDLGLQVLDNYFKKSTVQPTTPVLKEFQQLQEAEKQEVDLETLPPCFNNKLDVLQAALRAKNGDKFKALYYDGDLSYNDGDHSSADLALLQILAFYAGDNAGLIEEMFRESALFRPEKLVKSRNYLTSSIDKAIQHAQAARAATASTYNSDNFTVPNAGDKKKKRGMLTLDIFNQWLQDNNIKVRYNQLTHYVEIHFPYENDNDPHDPQKEKTKHIWIHDKLKQDYTCSITEVENDIQSVATLDEYNPILELLEDPEKNKSYQENKKGLIDMDCWVSPFNTLCDSIMQLPESDKLSRQLIKRWLIQTRVMWENTNRNKKHLVTGQGLLVLNGEQGIGKTMLVRMLGFFDTSLYTEGAIINPSDKDSVMQATQYAITEWGEIESTFKKDITALKGFITKNKDQYRAPYDRKPEYYPRTTAFIGTCNSDRFLIDETGNRRYWTIPCPNKFDIKGMLEFDTFALWKQVEEWIDAGETYELSNDEKAAMDARNKEYNRLVKGQQEIKDILLDAEINKDNYYWKNCTASEFQKGHPSLSRYEAVQVGKALKAEGFEPKNVTLTDTATGKTTRRKGYHLPIPYGAGYEAPKNYNTGN